MISAKICLIWQTDLYKI